MSQTHTCNERKHPLLLVATWGLPLKWSLAVYQAEEQYLNPMISRTSLSLLTEMINPERVVIVVQDTIAFSKPETAKHLCSPGFLHGERLDKGDDLDYRKVRRWAERIVRDWIRECSCSEALARLECEERLVIEVVPGRGRYNNWEYGVFEPDGEEKRVNMMSSFYAESLFLLLKHLRETKARTLAVDLTHGQNYAPSLFSHAAQMALRLHGIAMSKGENPPEYELLLYNSDPIPLPPPSNPYDAKLTVRKVMQQTVKPLEVLGEVVIEAVSRVPSNHIEDKIRPPIVLNRYLKASGKQGNYTSIVDGTFHGENSLGFKELLLHGRRVASALLYSMPLAFYLLAREVKDSSPNKPPIETLIEGVDRLRNLQENKTTIDSEKHKIYPYLAFDGALMEELFLLATLSNYAYNNADQISVNNPYTEGLSLDDLGKITKLMPTYF